MKTPSKYNTSIRNRTITYEILAKCLYSVNKRAKNCRDQEKSYRDRCKNNQYYYDRSDSEEKYRKKKNEYYEYKEMMLKLIKPLCIHYEEYKKRVRYFDYEAEYFDIKDEDVVKYSSYYDRDMKEEVEFKDVYEKRRRYYLYYEIAGYSFHSPIEEDELEQYMNLQKIDLRSLITIGKDIDDLISMQFVRKVIALVQSGDYTLI